MNRRSALLSAVALAAGSALSRFFSAWPRDEECILLRGISMKVWSLDLAPGKPIVGTFTLDLDGYTIALPYNFSARMLQDAMECAQPAQTYDLRIRQT